MYDYLQATTGHSHNSLILLNYYDDLVKTTFSFILCEEKFLLSQCGHTSILPSPPVTLIGFMTEWIKSEG